MPDKAFNIATNYTNQTLPNSENISCTICTDEKWLELIKYKLPSHIKQ
jgi:hypothetical protein